MLSTSSLLAAAEVVATLVAVAVLAVIALQFLANYQEVKRLRNHLLT